MIPDEVRRVLDRHGLEALEFEPGSTPTVPEAARRLGVAQGQIAKSLLFVGRDGRRFLVVCAGDRRVDSGALKRLVGTKCRMARPDEILAATGRSPGAVCPFALVGVEVLVDASLAEHEVVYPAAGTDASGVPIHHDQLLAVTRGLACDVARPR